MLVRSGMGMQLSGSVGGVVAARNKGGAYLRGRTVPVNPNSVAQQAVRSAFSSAAERWRSLSAVQRAGWEGYAQETPVSNRLGELIFVSGFGHYVRSNAFRIGAGAGFIDNAPASAGQPNLGNVTAIVLSESDGLTVTVTGTECDGPWLLSIGPPVSAGVTFVGVRFGRVAAGLDFSQPIGSRPFDFSSRYGGVVENQRRPVRLAASDAFGRLSNVISQIVTVTG